MAKAARKPQRRPQFVLTEAAAKSVLEALSAGTRLQAQLAVRKAPTRNALFHAIVRATSLAAFKAAMRQGQAARAKAMPAATKAPRKAKAASAKAKAGKVVTARTKAADKKAKAAPAKKATPGEVEKATPAPAL